MHRQRVYRVPPRRLSGVLRPYRAGREYRLRVEDLSIELSEPRVPGAATAAMPLPGGLRAMTERPERGGL